MHALFLVFVVGIIVIILVMLSRRGDASRATLMKRWADAHDYTFEAQGLALEGFKVLAKGGSRTNVLRATKDIGTVEIFDFTYTSARVGNDPGQKTERTVVTLHSKSHTPHFFLRRQVRDLDAMAQQLGGQDINFDDDAAFSEKYVLQTFGDEAALRQFFSPALRAHFAKLSHRDLVVEGRGGVLLVHEGRLLATPAELDALLEDAMGIRRQWS